MFGTILVTGSQQFTSTAIYTNYRQGYDRYVVYRRETVYTYGNEPPTRISVDKFAKVVETLLERRRRISGEQKRRATMRLRRFGLPPMPEALFDKPTFVRRACGSRWRVMTP